MRCNFQSAKDELAPSTSGFHTLCPTRWTVHAASLQSILDNYEVYFWEEIKDDITDSGIKARVIGVEATMSNFNFLFGLLLGELGDNDFVASSLETQLELLSAMFSPCLKNRPLAQSELISLTFHQPHA